MRRFYYISAPAGLPGLLHIQVGKLTEGEPLACGRRQQRGWLWSTKRSTKRARICKACEAAL